MSKIIDLIDKLPPFDALELNIATYDPPVPFLHSDADSFERWVSLRNYELGRPPLSSDELQALRENWQK